MQPDASQCSVIVADDSLLMRDILRTNLAAFFGHVHLATDGLEAVEAARGLSAALVILDYRMVRLNGVEACREIRQLPGYDKVPIVLLTAYDDDKLGRDAARAGATLMVPKPVIFEQLMAKIAPLVAANLGANAATATSGLTQGRDVLYLRRRIEAETATAKRRYTGLAERTPPFLDSWRR